jgi:hypothetical protein
MELRPSYHHHHHQHHHHHHWKNRPIFSYSLPGRLPGSSELDHPFLTFSDFGTVIFLQSKVVSLASNP